MSDLVPLQTKSRLSTGNERDVCVFCINAQSPPLGIRPSLRSFFNPISSLLNLCIFRWIITHHQSGRRTTVNSHRWMMCRKTRTSCFCVKFGSESEARTALTCQFYLCSTGEPSTDVILLIIYHQYDAECSDILWFAIEKAVIGVEQDVFDIIHQKIQPTFNDPTV
jgi:hypothetical protein